MSWIETIWSVAADNVDVLLANTLSLGSIGSYEPVPLSFDTDVISGETRAEAERTLHIYFSAATPISDLAASLRAMEGDGVRLLTIDTIAQGDWATAWKKYFKPFHLTDQIVIRPSWESYTPQPGEHIITLDPGMAFGTGQHDSTRFCAELLSQIRKEHPQHCSLLDVGCGSGILSMAGKALGFNPVMGIDNDPHAVEVAKDNLALNPQLGTIRFEVCNDALTQPSVEKADVVVANIIAEVLCHLKPRLLDFLKPGGLLILSGIIPERANDIEMTFSTLRLLEKKESKEWRAYLYSK